MKKQHESGSSVHSCRFIVALRRKQAAEDKEDDPTERDQSLVNIVSPYLTPCPFITIQMSSTKTISPGTISTMHERITPKPFFQLLFEGDSGSSEDDGLNVCADSR